MRKGFTLIELLVVVAIVGVLASIVLSSLNSARGKGGDAAIKANLANMRSQAEILFSDWGTYAVDATPTYFALAQCANTADTMFSNTNIWGQIQSAYNAGQGVAQTQCVTTSAGCGANISEILADFVIQLRLGAGIGQCRFDGSVGTLAPCAVQVRENNGSENADDGDYDQKFN